MIPYFIFMIITQWFIISISAIGDEPKEGLMRAKIIILASSTLVLWSYQIYYEIIQIKFMYEDGSLKKYFTSLMNIADISCLMMTLALCLTNYGDTPSMGLETQAYMGAFVSFFLFNKCFDWLRVFEETAFLI